MSSSGPELESAWRSHHKRAGRRVAHLIPDLPASPPLGQALDLAERFSIRIGAGLASASLSSASSGRSCQGDLVAGVSVPWWFYESLYISSPIIRPSILTVNFALMPVASLQLFSGQRSCVPSAASSRMHTSAPDNSAADALDRGRKRDGGAVLSSAAADVPRDYDDPHPRPSAPLHADLDQTSATPCHSVHEVPEARVSDNVQLSRGDSEPEGKQGEINEGEVKPSVRLFEWPPPGSFRAAAEALDLPLFGSCDHSSPSHVFVAPTQDVAASSGGRGGHAVGEAPSGEAPSRRSPPDTTLPSSCPSTHGQGLLMRLYRAGFLLFIFSPFLTIGLPLLLLSNCFLNATAAPGRTQANRRGNDKGRGLTFLALRRVGWRTLLWGCRSAGAAMIKV